MLTERIKQLNDYMGQAAEGFDAGTVTKAQVKVLDEVAQIIGVYGPSALLNSVWKGESK